MVRSSILIYLCRVTHIHGPLISYYDYGVINKMKWTQPAITSTPPTQNVVRAHILQSNQDCWNFFMDKRITISFTLVEYTPGSSSSYLLWLSRVPNQFSFYFKSPLCIIMYSHYFISFYFIQVWLNNTKWTQPTITGTPTTREWTSPWITVNWRIELQPEWVTYYFNRKISPKVVRHICPIKYPILIWPWRTKSTISNIFVEQTRSSYKMNIIL